MIGDQLRNKMVLFGHPKCMNTAKCLQLAAEKGIDIEAKVVDMNNSDSDFLTTSPLEVAPALRDVKYNIAGILAVMSYMDDKGFGPSLVPRNGVSRAMMYQWIVIAMQKVQPAIAGGDVDSISPALNEMEKVLSNPPKKGDFICGDFTLADIHWSGCMNMLEINGHGDLINAKTNLSQWFVNVKKHPSTSKEDIIPFSAVPTADDIQSNTIRDISINA